MKLYNKIVVITGASSGIGEACAIACAREKARIILIARRNQKLIELKARLADEFNVDVLKICLDICDKTAVEDALNNLPTGWSDIDILINNAGLALTKDRFQNADIDDLECMINTNLKGLVYVTRGIIPRMVAKNFGHIINLGSISGRETYAGGTVYCATKFAITGFTSGLKKDLLGTKVQVSLINPGMVKTEFSNVRFNNDLEQADKVYHGMTPLTSHDIAETVLFCLTRPPHVNISEIVILPTDQASVDLVHRES